MLPSIPVVVFEYCDLNGRSPFASWFDGLNAQAAAKIAVALSRLEQGNFSKVKSVGGGVMEYKIDFGPGYRIHFGKDGNRLVIVLGGGTKQRQEDDIRVAQTRWADYKHRKKQAQCR